MDSFTLKINSIENIAQNVKRIRVEKPPAYIFTPGQSAFVSINQPELKYKKHPFSFTSLPNWTELEFIIKYYEAHDEIAKRINELKIADKLIIGKAWGTISYKGMGVFIAGGTGITPFISILRDLEQRNKLAGNSLIYCNRTESDIIFKTDLENMLPNETMFLLSREIMNNFYHGRIDEPVLRMFIVDFARYFYVCGPESFVENTTAILKYLGADKDSIIFEDTSGVKLLS